MTLISKITAIFMSIITIFSGIFSIRDFTPEAEVSDYLSIENFSGSADDYVIINTDADAAVNSMVLKEKGMNITGFTLEALIDGEYKTLTKGDTVSQYRFCSFEEVTASSFKLTVTDCSKDSFTLKSIKLGKADVKNSDFKVVSYLVAGALGADYMPDPGKYTVTTDLIIFGAAVFDENGDITLTNMDNIVTAMEKMRSINPEIKIHLNFLGPSAYDDDWNKEIEKKAELHVEAMQKNRNKFINNIVSVLDTYGFDGMFFDWEYPINFIHQLVFSSFLVSLDKALGEYELGSAMASWCCYLTPLARSVIDNVEVMCYDMFDDYGYHAAFPSAYESVAEFLKNGYKKEQLHLGLAFYARPTDGGAYWFSYNENVDKLDYYTNICDVNYNGNVFTSYFNSAQLVRDKTAYALNAGLGGVMIWNLECDVDYSSSLSLYRAINDATE